MQIPALLLTSSVSWGKLLNLFRVSISSLIDWSIEVVPVWGLLNILCVILVTSFLFGAYKNILE